MNLDRRLLLLPTRRDATRTCDVAVVRASGQRSSVHGASVSLVRVRKIILLRNRCLKSCSPCDAGGIARAREEGSGHTVPHRDVNDLRATLLFFRVRAPHWGISSLFHVSLRAICSAAVLFILSNHWNVNDHEVPSMTRCVFSAVAACPRYASACARTPRAV